MTTTPLLSIVIPIYNVEKYIGKCFDSIYSQNIEENLFEIIAINDGSPDNSGEIIAQYSNRYKNILYINQENSGVSVARNVGIQHSKGEFITFIDPDDWIGNNILPNIFTILKNHIDSDIIILNSLKAETNTANYNWLNNNIQERKSYKGIDLFLKYKYVRGSVCGAIYNKTFLKKNNIVFPIGIRNAEDTIFFNECLSIASDIKFFNLNFYYIFNRVGSASKTKDLQRINRYYTALDYIDTLNKKHGFIDPSPIIEYLKYIIISSLTSYTLTLNLPFNKIPNRQFIKKHLPIEPSTINRTKITILNKSFYLFYFLMKLKHLSK